MKDKSKLTAIILVVFTILVVIFTFFNNKVENQEKREINIVTNYSNFYTVNSCIYRTITYISSQDNSSLLLVLSDEYKKANKINKNNVMSFFTGIESDSTFESRKMFYENINKNITKYYVQGYVQPNQIADDEITGNIERKDLYFIVYIDKNNKTFSIEPYSGEIFIGGEENE